MTEPQAISQQPLTPTTSEVSPADNSQTSGLLFVGTCLVLPIVWGMTVHLVFKRIRRKMRTKTDENWPDYQI